MRRSPTIDDYFFFFILLAFCISLMALLSGWWHFYLGVGRVIRGGASVAYRDNDLYLLSAIVQSLAALMAMVITISLVTIQLSAQFIGEPAVVLVHLRNYKLWVTVSSSVFAMSWNFILLGRIKNSPMDYNVYIDLGVLFALLNLLLFVPYLLSALGRTKAEVAFDDLLRRIK